MSQVGAKLAERWGQEAPGSTQEGLLGVMLGASWQIWGAFLGHLAEKAAKQKTFKNLWFSQVWGSFFSCFSGAVPKLGSPKGSSEKGLGTAVPARRAS